ncbi:MAG: thioredoxin reductase, partial [Alphaproteobacteria bacterium]|nr:thioredoxin reductase [Alphaproteobacteria bacterium]
MAEGYVHSTTIDTRREQMFPTLGRSEIARLRRFSEHRTYEAGACIVRTGEVAPGFFLILSGEIAIKQRDSLG